MTREKAMEILRARGWDEIGADEIVSQWEEFRPISELTVEELIEIAEDYEDR